MPDVFLSYNRNDQATARLYAEALEAEGLSVWWDVTLRSGEAYDEVTEAALRGARAVVVLWSPRSTGSRWVRAEATLADRNRTLVPAMIEPCERPIMFELTQTAELSHWRGDVDDPAWQAFVRDVRGVLARQAPDGLLPLVEQTSTSPQIAAPARDQHGEAPSLAVLPFTNRSGLPEDDVFAIGMVEDLIDALSQGVNLRVIASSATARFRTGGLPDLEIMARHLGVRYVMEGNVRRAGEDLRVTAQLVEAASGAILWTQKFERPLPELAALQEELVLDLAAHLDSQVHRMEMERVLRKPANLTAWECVTRAIAAYRQITPQSVVQAMTEAQRAVELSPEYGLAHAMLADAKATVYMWTTPDSADAIRGIREHIERALALEPDSAMVLAHVAEAFNYIGQPQDAIRPAERAIQLSPNFGLAHYSCGVGCLLLDRIDDALAHFDAELKAAPGSHTLFASYIWRGAAHVRGGDWDAAARAYAQATQINPGATSGYLGEAFVAARTGSDDEARALMIRVRQLEPKMSLADWERIIRRGLAGNPVGDAVIQHIRDLWKQGEETR
ncbi:TIR domain-containing protein [Sphingomonas cavernae]|uniref:TIR domain-containing protein n=1 Tax=Sphingomonas cavernae TaxID=2320861 RepID=UPI0016024578|nr:TIR domain-containing protein [Sphingomonas cavernae]